MGPIGLSRHAAPAVYPQILGRSLPDYLSCFLTPLPWRGAIDSSERQPSGQKVQHVGGDGRPVRSRRDNLSDRRGRLVARPVASRRGGYPPDIALPAPMMHTPPIRIAMPAAIQTTDSLLAPFHSPVRKPWKLPTMIAKDMKIA